MSHPIDVGSVLGGRYKVTATVLTSHDQDLVLDGVDQVLNRPVSILVAGPGNAEQVAQSAREVATGERPGHVQILDLGVSDNTTYLITNHSTAPMRTCTSSAMVKKNEKRSDSISHGRMPRAANAASTSDTAATRRISQRQMLCRSTNHSMSNTLQPPLLVPYLRRYGQAVTHLRRPPIF